MAKPTIDPATAATIRAAIQQAANGNIVDQVRANTAAIEAILRALEDAK